MADPDLDSGLVLDNEGKIDIANSEFFDVGFSYDTTAEEYVGRIFFELSLAIESHLPKEPWTIQGRPTPPPTLASIPKSYFASIAFLLLVATAGLFQLLLPSSSNLQPTWKS